MKKRDDSTSSTDNKCRRRGRPAGKNRVPLSLTERRARNAQYERERRVETAEAMAQLAEAACCDPQITNADLLATVISQIHSQRQSKSIEDLKQMNDDLESQIAELKNLLGNDPDLKEKCLRIDSNGSETNSDSDSESCDERPTKYRKTSKEDTVHYTSKEDTKSTSSQKDSSSDSQDSVWSHHQLGKTVPTQKMPETFISVEGELERSSSPQIKTSESLCTEWRQCTASESEVYSENSNLSKLFSEHQSHQQDVKVEFQLIPEQRMDSERSAEDQSNLVFSDPFTEREKAILERLGCSDFINFQDIYCEDQSQLTWPLDYARY